MKSLSRILIMVLIFVSCDKMAPVYTLKVSVNPSRSGDVTAIQNPNGTLSLVAYAAADYKFKGWSGSLTGIKNPVIIPFNKNLDITAIFEKITFPFIVAVEGHGTVIIEILSLKTTNPANGSRLRLTPVPDDGYEFAEWTGDLTGKQCPAEVIVTQSTNIGCKFVQKKSYPLNMTITGNGSVTEEVVTLKSNTYIDGTSVELTPAPDEGWEFVEWTGDLTGNANPAQITVTDTTDITCVFQKEPIKVNFTIVGNGTATDGLDNIKSGSIYEDGTRIRIDADPDEGWSFVGWTGDITSTDNPKRFNITKTMNITCTFQPDADGDGVSDELDHCPNSPPTWQESVDENGCANSQKDDDGDGVMNNVDKCSDTPSGEAVDAHGCSLSQKTYVPDNNFEQKLIQLGYDDVLDDYVRTSNIENITTLNIQYLGISDLTGIEDFTKLYDLTLDGNTSINSLNLSSNTNLNKLSCRYMTLTSLDVSSNSKLYHLKCDNNNLTSLNLSSNPILNLLNCGSNSLSSLDLSSNPILTDLRCYNNSLTSLDVSNNPNLIFLQCYNNQLSNLNLSNNTNLTQLYGSNNSLTSLDLSNNTKLIKLHCQDNDLTSIDISNSSNLEYFYCYVNELASLDVSGNPNLKYFNCSDNTMTNLDVSNNTKLITLSCKDNLLTSLNISNNLTLTYLYCQDNRLSSFDVSNNTILTILHCENNLMSCIKVNQAQLDAMPGADWTKDGGATYSLNCAPPVY